MAELNEVRLIGRLTRDPEMRQIPSGQNVTNFSLATSQKYKDGNGILQEDTTFIDITCWARLAEITAQYLRKGSPVFVGGRLRFETWNDRETGKKRSKLTVTAQNIQFLESKAAAESSRSAGGYQGGGAPATSGHQGGGYQNNYNNAPQDQWAPPVENVPPTPPAPPAPPAGNTPPASPDWNQPPMDEPPF